MVVVGAGTTVDVVVALMLLLAGVGATVLPPAPSARPLARV